MTSMMRYSRTYCRCNRIINGQVALGNRVVLSRTPSETEWHDLYKMCQKQSVTGVALDALESLSEQRQKPPLDLLYQWIGDAEQIKQQNLRVNRRCVEISRMFAEVGFKTCILKGQGMQKCMRIRWQGLRGTSIFG